MKKIIKIAMTGLVALVGLIIASCSSTPDVLNSIELDRCLSPLNFSATVANGKDVTFKWDVMQGADRFVLELYRDAEMTDLYSTKTVLAEEVPYLAMLESDMTFYARVKAQNSKGHPADSKWTLMEKKISTFEVKNALYPEIVTRTAASITVKWNKEAEDASELSHLTYAKAEPKAVATEVKIDAAAIAAGQCEVAGLAASTQYILTLYFKSADRGKVAAWTMPDTSGATEVSSVAALLNALSGNGTRIAETTKIVVKYNDGTPYELGTFTKIAKPVAIYGESAPGGKRPVIHGNFELQAGATSFTAEGLAFGQSEGAGVDDQTLIRLGAKEAISLIGLTNCEVSGYSKGIFYDNSKEATVEAQHYTSLLIHDIGDGQDVFDMRKGTYGSFILENSSFYNGGRTVLRADATTTFSGDVAVKNMFFYKVSASANSNNAGILYVRGEMTGTFSLINNLFMEMAGGSTKSGLIANDGNAKVPGAISNNHFYNCTMAAWFTKLPQGDAIAGGGSMLAGDPCVKAAASNFTLKNDVLIGKYVGDPRWWANAGPLIPEALTAIDAPHVWNLSDAAYFTPGDINQSVVMGNLYFDVSDSSTPLSLSKDRYVHFDKASLVAGSGVPADHFLKFIVKGPGSVVMQPLRNDNGNGTEMVTVIVNGKSCGAAVGGTLAQNKQKVVLRDLPKGAETEVYIVSTGIIDLAYLEWSDDITYDPVAITLEKPVVTLSTKSVVNGTEQALDISWKAINFAHTYTLTFGEAAPVSLASGTLKHTIPAATIKALAAGKYMVKLQALSDPNDPRYKNSEIAEALFTVEFLGDGSPVVLEYPNAGSFTLINAIDKDTCWEFTKNADPNKVLDPAPATTGSFYTPAVVAGKVIDRIEVVASASMTKKMILYTTYSDKAGYTDKCSDEVALNSATPVTIRPDTESARLYLAASTGGAIKVVKATVYYKDKSAVDPGAPKSYAWDFTTAGGFPLEELVADKTVGEVTLIATSSKKLNLDGTRLKMNGASEIGIDHIPTARAIQFSANSNGTLTVSCASGSSGDLTRELWISVGGVISLIGTAPAAQGDLILPVTGINAQTDVYIYCKAGINLYSLTWNGVK